MTYSSRSSMSGNNAWARSVWAQLEIYNSQDIYSKRGRKPVRLDVFLKIGFVSLLYCAQFMCRLDRTRANVDCGSPRCKEMLFVVNTKPCGMLQTINRVISFKGNCYPAPAWVRRCQVRMVGCLLSGLCRTCWPQVWVPIQQSQPPSHDEMSNIEIDNNAKCYLLTRGQIGLCNVNI